MTSAPAFNLRGTYLQYKHAERMFIEWLLENVSRKALPITSRSLISGLSNEAAAEKLPIYSILPLVREVSTLTSIAEIPLNITRAFHEILESRTECSEWYKINTNLDDIDKQLKNESHDYPLQILRQAADLLQDKLTTEDGERQRARSEVDEVPAVFESYDASEVVSLVEDVDLGTKAIPKTKQPRTDELLLRTYCFMREVQAIEAALIQEWASYKTGNQSFLGAVIITNTAIDLVRTMETEVYLKFEPSPSISSKLLTIMLPEIYHHLKRTAAGIASEPIFRMQEIIYNASHDATSVCIAEMDYFRATIDVQFEYEKAVFTAITMPLRFRARQNFRGPEDEVSRLLKWYMSRKDVKGPQDVPLCVAFAARAAILVFHMLRGHGESTSLSLVAEMRSLRTRVKEHLTLLQLTLPNYNHESERQLRSFTASNKIVLQSLNEEIPNMEGMSHEDVRTAALHAGLNYLWFEYQSIANITTANYAQNVFPVLANVVQICREGGTVSADWPDMAFYIEQVGQKAIFKAGKPMKAEQDQYCAKLAYVCGYKSQRSREAAPTGTYETQSEAHRTMPPPRWSIWPMLTLARSRMFNGDSFNDDSFDHLDLLLRATTCRRMTGRKVENVQFQQSRGAVVTFENRHQLYNRTRLDPELPKPLLLHLMRHELRRELEILKFNYLDFNKACLQLTHLLAQHWQQKGWTDRDITNSGRANQIRVVALDLADDLQAVAEGQYWRAPGAQQRIQAAGRIIEEWLADNGSIGLGGMQQRDLKKLSELNGSLRKKLKRFDKRFGTPQGLFTEEQRSEVDWLPNTYKVEDVVRELYGSNQMSKGTL